MPKNKKQKKKNNRLQKVKRNRAKGRAFKNSNPLSKLRFQNREYLAEITSDGSSSKTWNFVLNAGGDSFPFLSGISRSFEYYYFHSLKVTYEPTCSAFTDGSINMAIEYDVTDSFDSIDTRTLLAMDKAASGPVRSPLTMHAVKGGLSREKKYFTSSGEDADRLADVGRLLVILEGVTDIAGKIFVDYDVELSVPQYDAEVQTQVGGKLEQDVLDGAPFLGIDTNEFMVLSGTTAQVMLNPENPTKSLIFTEPSRTYEVLLQLQNNGDVVPAPWSGFVNCTVGSFQQEAQSSNANSAEMRATITTDDNVSPSNPASILAPAFTGDNIFTDVVVAVTEIYSFMEPLLNLVNLYVT